MYRYAALHRCLPSFLWQRPTNSSSILRSTFISRRLAFPTHHLSRGVPLAPSLVTSNHMSPPDFKVGYADTPSSVKQKTSLLVTPISETEAVCRKVSAYQAPRRHFPGKLTGRLKKLKNHFLFQKNITRFLYTMWYVREAFCASHQPELL